MTATTHPPVSSARRDVPPDRSDAPDLAPPAVAVDSGPISTPVRHRWRAALLVLAAVVLYAIALPMIDRVTRYPSALPGSPVTIGMDVTVTPATGWAIQTDTYRPGGGQPGSVALRNESSGATVAFQIGRFDGDNSELLDAMTTQLRASERFTPGGTPTAATIGNGLAATAQTYVSDDGTTALTVAVTSVGGTGIAVLVGGAALTDPATAALLSSVAVPASNSSTNGASR